MEFRETPHSVPAGEWRELKITSIPCAEQALRQCGAQGADRSLDNDAGERAVRIGRDHLALITNAHERDRQRFAQQQQSAGATEPATWRSSREAALFRLSIAVPGQHAGILETGYHAMASFIARARSRSGSGSRRPVSINALTSDRA